MALKDILNSGKYADDMVLSLPDGTTATVGEMRALEQEEKAALLQRSQVLTQAETELATRIHAAASRGILNPVIEPSDANIRREAAAQFGLDESDPLLGPVVKEFKRLETERKAEMEALKTSFAAETKSLKDITAKVTGAYLNDYYGSRFTSATSFLPADISKKVSLEDAIKFAETNRLLDSAGRYDITAAVDRLTWNDMKEHERKQVKSEALASADKEAQLARLRPGNSSSIRTEPAKDAFIPTIKEGDRVRTKTFDEVLAEAAVDDSLWASAINGTGNIH